MTLKLDERIYEGLPFTCFTAEAAKRFVGQMGYFSDEMHSYQDLDKTDFRTLDRVGGDEVPFKSGCLFYPFFLPAEFVRPAEEKKWRPFLTTDEFLAKFPLLSTVTYREKKNSNCYTVCVIGIGRGRNGTARVNLGGFFYELDNLFNCYELQDKDGKWVPFGVEE